MSAILQRARTPSAPRARFWYPYLLIAPAMIVLVIVSLVAFVYAIYLSFHEARFGRVTDFVGLATYTSLLTTERFWTAFGVAALFLLIAVPIEFMLGLPGALVLNQRTRGRLVFVPLLFVPPMMASIAV